jgi:hypothetical protein
LVNIFFIVGDKHMDEPSFRRWQVIFGIATAVIAFVGLFPHSSPTLDPQPNAIQVETPTEAQTKPSPTPTTGNISVASSPSGASIYLDDKLQGITPMILNNTEQGSHEISLKLAGYEEYSQTASVNAGKEISILAILTPITPPSPTPTTGNISVDSNPIGASVYLDGTYEGETPKILKDIEQGSHKITLKLEKYKSWSQTISVDACETFSLSPTLISNTSQESNTPQVITKASGKINNVWIDNDVCKGNLKGVRIHTAFNIENLKDKTCSIGIKFYNDLDNTQLRDTNGYYGTDGYVVIRDYFIPPLVSSYQNDWAIFIPYDEFHMNAGTAFIKFKVAIIDDGDNILDASIWKYFSFIQY